MSESNASFDHEQSGNPAGDSNESIDGLMPRVYNELRRLAANVFRAERVGHTLQPTALVHEAYLQLAEATDLSWGDEDHFTATAGRVIRRVLVQHARKRNRLKREGRWRRLRLDTSDMKFATESADLVALDDALIELGKLDPLKEQIVELRFYSGLTTEEVARLLGMSSRTVTRHWRLARAWLRVQLDQVDPSDE